MTDSSDIRDSRRESAWLVRSLHMLAPAFAASVSKAASLLPALLLLALGVLAPSSPAEASFLGDLTGPLCAVFANGGHKCESTYTVHSDLSCDIKLGGASGVPDQKKHGYAFDGTCVSTVSRAVVVVSAKGTWDGAHYIADEAINIEDEGSGGLGGGIVSKFRCQADPWLNHMTICSLIERHATSLPNNFSYNSPATAEFVTLAKATTLSKKHRAAAPPPLPPPAPPHRPSPMHVASAPKPVVSHPPLVPAPVHGAAVLARPPVLHLLRKPRLTIDSARVSLTGSCDPEHATAVKVSFTITNHDAPLVRDLGDQAKVHVDEQPGGSGISGADALPSMSIGQTWRSSFPLGMGFPTRIFPGQHHLNVYIGPRNADASKLRFVPPKPYPVTLDVPAGYCQPKTGAPPSGLAHPRPIPPLHLRPVQTKPATPKPAPSSGQQPRVH